jgi:rhamnosyltransferase
MKASVILPVKNAGTLFEDVLRSVETQEYPDFEVILVDSGSKDGTLERCQKFLKESKHPTQLFTIAAHEYGHGRTRNFAAEKASGDVLVYITHDASPATPQWLARIMAPFHNQQVGLVFGPHLPRADANPVIRAELLAFFNGFAERGKTTVYSKNPAPDVHRTGAPGDEMMRFSSDANAAIRRAAWQSCKFRDVTYCEDQLIAQDLIARDWWKVYEPQASVYHSHNFSVPEFFRRYVDEWAGMYRAFGYVDVKHWWHLPARIIRASAAVRAPLQSDPRLSRLQKIAWFPRAASLATVRQLGGYLGPRLDRMPKWIVKRISREAHLINA